MPEQPPEGFEPIVHSNPFGAHIGPIYECVEGEGFRRGFFISEKHGNSAGVAHGGVLMAFADIVLARAVMARIKGGAVTVRMTCDFIAPAKLGVWVEGAARVTHATKSLVCVEGQLSVSDRPSLAVQGLFKPLG